MCFSYVQPLWAFVSSLTFVQIQEVFASSEPTLFLASSSKPHERAKGLNDRTIDIIYEHVLLPASLHHLVFVQYHNVQCIMSMCLHSRDRHTMNYHGGIHQTLIEHRMERN